MEALILLALVVFGLGGSSDAEPEPSPEPEPGPPPSPPGEEEVAAAMCEILSTVYGQTPPLPPNQTMDQDLAVRAIKHFGMPGSWPPPQGAGTLDKIFYEQIETLARRVRAGEVGPCAAELPVPPTPPQPSPTPTPEPYEPPPLPEPDSLLEAICEVLSSAMNQGAAWGSFEPENVAQVVLNMLVPEYDWPPPQSNFNLVSKWEATLNQVNAVLADASLCNVTDVLLAISDVPKSQSWYRIKWGDSLAKVASIAYGTKQGTPENYPSQKIINQHPRNLGLWVEAPPGEEKLFPNGRISFMQEWFDDPVRAAERSKPGNSYAVIWIP